MKASLVVFALALLSASSTNGVRAADCTPKELSKVVGAQQDPAVQAACSTLVKDPSKPPSLTNLDFCKSPSCIAAIKGVVATLPDCTINGVPITTATSGLLASCVAGERPPPGPNGLPPPGASGLPPPGAGGSPSSGQNGLPPPAPGAGGDSQPTLPRPVAPLNASATVTPTPTTASTVVAENATIPSNATATVKPAETDAETDTDAEAEKSETEEAGNPGSGSKSMEEDTAIVAPNEIPTTTPSPMVSTPTPAKSSGSRVVLSTISSAAVIVLAIVLM